MITQESMSLGSRVAWACNDGVPSLNVEFRPTKTEEATSIAPAANQAGEERDPNDQELSTTAPRLGFKGILLSTLRSNNTPSLIGNLLIVSHLNLGFALNVICAGLAIYNEGFARLKLKQGDSQTTGTRSEGLISKAKDLLSTPGIYRYSLSIAFVFCAAENFIAGAANTLLTPTFVFLALGNFFTARDINRDLSTRDRDVSIKKASPLVECLANGALWWGIADILAGISALELNGISLLEAPPIFYSAALTSLCGILAVFALGKRANRSPLPFGFNAACNYQFGIGNFQYLSSGGIAPTLCLWGTGSVILALGKIFPPRAQKEG
jgi:hypothetical protein